VPETTLHDAGMLTAGDHERGRDVAEAGKSRPAPEADSKPDSGRGRLEDTGQEGATEDAAAFAYEDEGVEIVRVRTGAEALTAGQLDLVLLDLVGRRRSRRR
jgi:hypothetical protein